MGPVNLGVKRFIVLHLLSIIINFKVMNSISSKRNLYVIALNNKGGPKNDNTYFGIASSFCHRGIDEFNRQFEL